MSLLVEKRTEKAVLADFVSSCFESIPLTFFIDSYEVRVVLDRYGGTVLTGDPSLDLTFGLVFYFTNGLPLVGWTLIWRAEWCYLMPNFHM